MGRSWGEEERERRWGRGKGSTDFQMTGIDCNIPVHMHATVNWFRMICWMAVPPPPPLCASGGEGP